MAFFDVGKHDLQRLSDTQLEELIARLSEAELTSVGQSPACVQWSGSITAPDDGIDIEVDVLVDTLDTGYLARPNTILQAKKHSMTASSITAEMRPKGKLSPTISQQAANGGSYIIVSLADDCSPPMRKSRLTAMNQAVEDNPNASNIHLDFYDRSKLHQWLRQHPSVALWVREVIGQPLSGWQPYGRWSNPPTGSDDTLILKSGVSIIMPSGTGKKLSIEDAIVPLRDLVRSTKKTIRVTGLSGVGKTRIVQSLFDENIAENALDRTIAIYVDAGASPDPSARAMLERLIAENRRAIVVLDNCPSDLHTALASSVAAARSQVSLITVEYDIRDDKPQTTEVVHIEAEGPDVAEHLLLRRFPSIGQVNARKIAEFANGNARVSLAVAERAEVGESLAMLSDAQLFDRLFEQRNQPDGSLRVHAELLSLVYSFSVASPAVGIDELEVLGSIYGIPRMQLFRSVATLLDRHIAQGRSHWRAILPHAIANRLARDALRNIPNGTLRSAFEAPGRDRLLMSFAHRLGLMHDHPVAQEIVETWLQDGELLGSLSNLDDTGARILDYVAPVAPNAVLNRIEAEIGSDDFGGMEARHHARRTTILSLLQSMAYEPEAFDRCVAMLLRVADFEDESNNYDAAREKIVRFFQAYLSGTHASLDQRLAVVRDALASGNPKRKTLGLRMLKTALDGPPWIGSGTNDFGARPRDFGYRPNHDELVAWRSKFIDLVVEMGLSNDASISESARMVLARSFRGMWHHQAIRAKLVEAARELNGSQPWVEGWKAVRSTIYFDYRKTMPEDRVELLPDDLAALERDLAPTNLMSNIRTYVLGGGHDHWALDDEFDDDEPKKYDASERRLSRQARELGEEFACSGRPMSALGEDLFATEYMPYRSAFGRGLARGALDRNAAWHELVEQLHRFGSENYNFSVLSGFLEEIDEQDREAAQALLDQCLVDARLRTAIVGLTPSKSFDENDLERCIAALQHPDTGPWMYGDLLWQDFYAELPEDRLLHLVGILFDKPNGDGVVLHGLCMKLHGEPNEADTLGVRFRRVGLVAATKRLIRSQDDPGGSTDHDMKRVIRAAFSFEGNEPEKEAWLDAIFTVVDERHGYVHSFYDVIRTTAELAPGSFLARIFLGDEDSQRRRRYFIERGGMERLPLAGVDIEVVIQWCQGQESSDVWPVIGASIKLWERTSEDGSIELANTAVRFLEASPTPTEVLAAFARRLEPRSWSGSRADIMQDRATALQALAEHSNPDIAKAASDTIKKIPKRIDAERHWEQRRDEEQEQRFE
jgi:hypothetical protein